MGTVPELPEVAALALFLRERTVGRVVGRRVTDVSRHGEWIDLTAAAPDGGPLHLVVHPARAGWLRWHEHAPSSCTGRSSGC